MGEVRTLDRPRVRGDLAIVTVHGEAVVYDEVMEDLHHLNPTATIILSLCDGTATVDELVSDVAEAFGLDPQEIGPQIVSLVEQLEQAGLLEETSAE